MNSEVYKTLDPQQKALFDLLIDIRREIKRMADLLETEIERSEDYANPSA